VVEQGREALCIQGYNYVRRDATTNATVSSAQLLLPWLSTIHNAWPHACSPSKSADAGWPFCVLGHLCTPACTYTRALTSLRPPISCRCSALTSCAGARARVFVTIPICNPPFGIGAIARHSGALNSKMPGRVRLPRPGKQMPQTPLGPAVVMLFVRDLMELTTSTLFHHAQRTPTLRCILHTAA